MSERIKPSQTPGRTRPSRQHAEPELRTGPRGRRPGTDGAKASVVVYIGHK